MKLSKRLQIRLEQQGSRLKLDELSNSEFIDLIAEDYKPWNGIERIVGSVYPDEDFDDFLKGA